MTLFPYQLALELGVRLGASGRIGTATGHAVKYRLGRVVLELRSVTETIRWQATVGFTAAPLVFPLFGDQGFLEFFRCTFDGERREVELTPKSNLPRVA